MPTLALKTRYGMWFCVLWGYVPATEYKRVTISIENKETNLQIQRVLPPYAGVYSSSLFNWRREKTILSKSAMN